jgi:hypothetical protein
VNSLAKQYREGDRNDSKNKVFVATKRSPEDAAAFRIVRKAAVVIRDYMTKKGINLAVEARTFGVKRVVVGVECVLTVSGRSIKWTAAAGSTIPIADREAIEFASMH